MADTIARRHGIPADRCHVYVGDQWGDPEIEGARVYCSPLLGAREIIVLGNVGAAGMVLRDLLSAKKQLAELDFVDLPR